MRDFDKEYGWINPVEYKVLIEPEKVDDKSKGGMWLPDSARVREQYQVDRGIVVRMGGLAFSDWDGEIPQIGDKVIFEKYAGALIPTPGKRMEDCPRLCHDKDISAILKEQKEE